MDLAKMTFHNYSFQMFKYVPRYQRFFILKKIRKLENDPSPWDFAVFCELPTETFFNFQVSDIVGFLSYRTPIVCNLIFYRYFNPSLERK